MIVLAGIPIHTIGRSYNEVKDLITLPDDDEDEIYRGHYFLRRFPSSALGLKYLKFYNKTAKEKTIARIAGIYESKKSGDSAGVSVKKYSNNALNFKADIYVCWIH